MQQHYSAVVVVLYIHTHLHLSLLLFLFGRVVALEAALVEEQAVWVVN